LTIPGRYDKIRDMKKEFLEGGRVCNAHGIRGLLKAEAWCDSPKVLAAQKRIFFAEKDGSMKECKVTRGSVAQGFVLLGLEGLETREDAIALKNKVFYLKREDIPVPEGAYLIADLIGLPVIDIDSGRRYGTVEDITEVPRGQMYTIRTPKGGEVLLPAVKEFVKEIRPDDGIFIRPIPGFFEDEA